MSSDPKQTHHFIRIRTAERTWETSVECDDFLIGRDETVQVRIELLEVSRKHVHVSISEGRAYVQDLGSANGTFLGHKRLGPGERVPMPGPDAELILGDVAWITICPLPAPAQAPSPVDHTLTEAPAPTAPAQVPASAAASVPAPTPATATAPTSAAALAPATAATPAPAAPSAPARASLISETLAKIEQVQAEAVRFSEAIREEALRDAALQKTEREECEQQLGKLRFEIMTLEVRRDELGKETLELQLRAEALQKNCAELESTLAKSESMLASLEKRREEVELQSIESSAGFRAMETERESLTQEVARLRKNAETMDFETRKQKALCEAIEAELRAKKAGIEAAIGEIELQRIEAKTLLQKALNERDEVLLETTGKKKEFDQAVQLEQERLEAVRRETDEARQALEQIRSETEKCASERHKLEDQLNQARASAAEAKQELERDLREAEQLHAQREKTLENEFVQRGREMERELADAKLKELERIRGLENEAREAEKARKRFVLDEIIRAAMKMTAAGSSDEATLRKNVLTILEGKTIATVHAEAAKRSRKFWRKTALWASAPAALGLLFWLGLPGKVTSSLNRTIASENKKDSVFLKEIQDRGTMYQPPQDERYRDTYADNVLYLKGYVEMKRDEAEKKRWTLLLNDFIVGKLGLSDRVIPDFISKESVMIQELADERDKILPQFKDQGIARLADTEKRELPGLIALMESQENYGKFRAFEKSYYEDYIARAANSLTPKTPPTPSQHAP